MININISNFSIVSLLKLEITKSICEHSHCYFTALVADDELDKFFSKLEKEVKVSKNDKILFFGIVRSVETEIIDGNSLIHVKAVSNSYKLDRKEHTRIFQNTEKTYSDIIEFLDLSDFKINFINKKIKSKKIPYPVIQLEETDFDFIKRLFLKEEIPISVDDLSEATNIIWVGSKTQGNRVEIKANNYKINKSLDSKYYNLKVHNYYELQTDDMIKFKEQEFRIIEMKLFSKHSSLFTKFKLIPLNDNSYKKRLCKDKYRKKMTGKIFVTEVVNNEDEDYKGQLQLKYEIENDEESSNNFWYKYSTPYSNNKTGLFFTPEIGDKVLVRFTSEELPIAFTSIRDHKNEDFFSDPNEKYLINNFEREIHLGKEEINIHFQKDEQLIKMKEDGIFIKNNNTLIAMEEDKIVLKNSKISITLDDDLEIKSTNKIKLNSDNNTEIRSNELNCQTDSKINFTAGSKISLKGSKIKLN